jgi:hypothetical protein
VKNVVTVQWLICLHGVVVLTPRRLRLDEIEVSP